MDKKKIYDLDSTLSFGKYHSMPLRFVLASDPEYIMWCLDTLDWFSLSPVAMDYFCHFHRAKGILSSHRAEVMARMSEVQKSLEKSNQ